MRWQVERRKYYRVLIALPSCEEVGGIVYSELEICNYLCLSAL